MRPETVDATIRSFSRLAPRGTALVDRFYERLFARAPALWALFPRDMTEQKRKLLATLSTVVTALHELDGMRPQLRELGARHVGYGARRVHYAIVRDELVGAMADVLGDQWTDEQRAAWSEALDAISAVMLEGAAEIYDH